MKELRRWPGWQNGGPNEIGKEELEDDFVILRAAGLVKAWRKPATR